MNTSFHISILKDKMAEIQKRNANYSLRAFSKSLSIDPSTLSKILSGHRNIPAASISSFLSILKLNEESEKRFIESVSQSHKNSNLAKKKIKQKPIILDSVKYEKIVSNWEYYAILNLIELDNFIPTIEHISTRLGLVKETTEQMVNYLIDVNLLEICPINTWKRTYRSLTSSANIKSETFIKAYGQELDLAKEALHTNNPYDTGFYSITVQTNSETLQQIKNKSFNYLKALIHDLEKSSKEEVYQVGLQFFPLTKKSKQ